MHEAGQHRHQGLRHLGLERGQLQVQRFAGVGYQHARAARDGHDRQFGTQGRGVVQQQARGVHHFREAAHAQRAVLPQARVIERVVAGQGACVRRGRGGSRAGAARLDGDHRLAGPCRALQRCAEGGGSTDVLDVQTDHAGAGIGHQVVDGFGGVHVALIAGGDPLAQADAAAQHDVHPIRAQRAALADE
ncbi:hypothetical protein D3C87_1478290 [compost metagenome]